MTRNKELVLSLAGILTLVLLVVFTDTFHVKAAETVKERLQLQYWHTFDIREHDFRVRVVCDTETGNLLYITAIGAGTGTAVVPNGCHKDPHFSK